MSKRHTTKRRRCKHGGRAVSIIGVDVEAYACRKCDAVGVRSLGRANDDSPAVRLEMLAAIHLGGAPGRLPDAWDARSGIVEFGNSERIPEAWPWDPTRPLTGQYEEHLVRAAVTLDPVPDPNAIAAVALAGLDELPREPKHCDDYIDDESAPAALRAYLARARSPGHGMLTSDPFPRLFADYNRKRVRVVMASRLGDVGITADLQADITYQKRVNVEDLSNFGDTPDPAIEHTSSCDKSTDEAFPCNAGCETEPTP